MGMCRGYFNTETQSHGGTQRDIRVMKEVWCVMSGADLFKHSVLLCVSVPLC